MIKPPFTILILKDGRHPVTIRVTVILMLVLCAGIPILAGMAGFGLSELLRGTAGGILHSKTTSVHPGTATTPNTAETTITNSAVDIDGLYVSFVKDGGIEVSFKLTGATGNGKVYVWLVMNPDSPTQPGLHIHPRSPVFRGLPLDYRNGVVFDPIRERTVTVQIQDFPPDVSVDSLRVLVYAEEGTMLADKRFSIGRNPGT
jgi:hypothetical protein